MCSNLYTTLRSVNCEKKKCDSRIRLGFNWKIIICLKVTRRNVNEKIDLLRIVVTRFK